MALTDITTIEELLEAISIFCTTPRRPSLKGGEMGIILNKLIALTVPYNDATGDLDLGEHSIIAASAEIGTIIGTSAYFSGEVGGTFLSSSYGGALTPGDASFGNVRVSALNADRRLGVMMLRNGVEGWYMGAAPDDSDWRLTVDGTLHFSVNRATKVAEFLATPTVNGEIVALMTDVDTKSGIQSQYSTVNGTKRIYSRTPYTTTGNLITSNSDFTGGITGYTPVNLTDASSANLYSFVNHDGKTWLRLDETTAGATTNRGSVSIAVSIPPEYRNSVLEISFLTCGYFTGVNVGNESMSLNIQIPNANPERIYYYINPKGAASVTLLLNRSTSGDLASGLYVDYAELLVKEATYKISEIANGVPSIGGSIQLARWIIDGWDEAKQEKIIRNYRQMGGAVRVWLSADLLMSYTTKTSPTKRTNVSSTYLTAAYNSATTAKVPTGIDPAKIHYLDWIFNKCKQYGLKMHVTLGAGFNGGNGENSTTYGVLGVYEFLDTDTDVQGGLTGLMTTIVNRYKSYPNVIGWEINNEGGLVWKFNYAGISRLVAVPNNVSAQVYGGYKSWEKTTYSAIKIADPNRPVILNSESPYITTSDICDWYCPSFYPGSIRIRNSDISSSIITPFEGFGRVLTNVPNGSTFKVYLPSGSTLPTGLNTTSTYYVVNVNSNSFQLATTLGGSAITISGGSGDIYFYSQIGETGLATSEYILEKIALQPNFVYISEFGAYPLSGNRGYQQPAINATYITAMAARMKKYGVASLLTYDEGDLYFDPITSIYTAAGTAVTSVSTSNFVQQASTNEAYNNIDYFISGLFKSTNIAVKSAGNWFGPVTSAFQLAGSHVFGASGANGIVAAPDQGNTNNSIRLFFQNATSAFAIYNNNGTLTFNYGSSSGSVSGSQAMSISNTGVVNFIQPPTGPAATTASQMVVKSQLDAAVSGLGSGTVTNVSSANSDIAVANPTTTPALTLNNVNGIPKAYYDPTSSIQTQINSKAPTTSPTLTGTVIVPTPPFSTTATTAVNQQYLPSAAPVILTTITGIDTKVSAGYGLYTVPSGKTAVITAVIIRCTSATSITTGPTVEIKSGATTFYPSVALDTFQNFNDVYGFSTVGMNRALPAASGISIDVTPATGAAQTVEVTVIGYLR
jgi:hypothetical protein